MHLVEKRRAPRYLFRAPTEVTDTDSFLVLVAPTGDLSRFGCFVETSTPFPRGTGIKITIAHAGEMFTAYGRVAYHTIEGMGIAFNQVESSAQAILDKWLSQRAAEGLNL